MEIERKYLIAALPEPLHSCQSRLIEQGYLCTEPVVRIRRQNDDYILTYKSKGLLMREEHNLPLTRESYLHLLQKCDGRILSKTRYLIPFGNHTIEADYFHGDFDGLRFAEVEFDSPAQAEAFLPPDWFGPEVTMLPEFQNNSLSGLNRQAAAALIEKAKKKLQNAAT